MTLDCTPQALVTTAAPMQAVPDGYQGALLLALFCTLAGVAVDPQALMTRAKCLQCDLDGMEELVAIDLLRQIAGASSDPNVLANDARCIDCNVPSGFRMEVLLSVACLMAQNGPIQHNDPDVQVFIDTAGITDKPTIDALNVLVDDLKNIGLWTSFDAIYPFVGGTANSNSYNLVDPTKYQITWHGNVIFNATGIVGDGAGAYGDTGFVPSTAANPHYTLNSAAIGIYCRTAAPNNSDLMGGADPTGNVTSAFLQILAGTLRSNLNTAASLVSQNVASMRGTSITTRSDAANATLYLPDGTSKTAAAASSSDIPGVLAVLAVSQNGSPVVPTNANLAFGFISRGFSAVEVAQIQAAILTFETSLGRA